jgi:uncharacterized SAM-binding protein YcdF (DUF218 family)
MRAARRSYRPYGGKSGRRWLKGLALLLAAGVLCFAALEGIVLAGSRTHIEGEPKVMIILGCQVKPWGPSELLLDRLDTALAYLEGRDDVQIIVSGGQGKDEPTTEAAAMRDYLVKNGIGEDRIWLEDESHNTHQNLAYSFDLLREKGEDLSAPYIIVSNGFHLSRAVLLADRVDNGAETYTLAAPSSHAPSRIKMYFREPLALVKSFIFDQ